MNGYAPVDGATLSVLTSAEISLLFRKPPGWFRRDRVRKQLYARGFPHPLFLGRWSAEAVANWIATAGSNPRSVGPNPPRKARRSNGKHRPNGYAPVTQ